MKRFFYLLPIFALIATVTTAQTVKFSNLGAALPAKDSIKIAAMLACQFDFYNKLRPIDTVHVRLMLIDNEALYKALCREKREKKLPKRYAEGLGFYSTKDSTAYINKAKKRNGGYLLTVYHECTHYFTHFIFDKAPPIWISEGLSGYFEYSKYKKKTFEPYLDDYSRRRIKTMMEIKDIDVKDYLSWKRSDFMKTQFTNENYSYVLAYGIVYFLIEKDFDTFRQIVSEINAGKSSLEAIESCYTGGFSVFEKDLMEYYMEQF